MTDLLGQTWPHAHGVRLSLSKLAIDTGFEAPAVYAWARQQGFAQVIPIKGVEGFNRAAPVTGPSFVDATEGGRKIRRGARLWTIAVSTFKAETYRFLRLSKPTDEDAADGAQGPAGLVHLPHGVDAEWVKQLVAEHLVTVTTKRGFQKLEWQKVRERNEALDCRVYARAAVWIAGADRWSEDKWRDLEDQVGPSLRTPTTRTRTSKPGVSPVQTRHRPSGRATGSARAGSGSEEQSWPGRPTNSMR